MDFLRHGVFQKHRAFEEEVRCCSAVSARELPEQQEAQAAERGTGQPATFWQDGFYFLQNTKADRANRFAKCFEVFFGEI